MTTPNRNPKPNSGKTYEDVYLFSFRDGFVPLVRKMAEAMGRDEFMGVLQGYRGIAGKG
jgi:hypothetical protein